MPSDQPVVYEDWYPEDIDPPRGTEYPCALTALPREMTGIPAGDHRYINHVYSMLLEAIQAKLPMLQAVWAATHDEGGDLGGALDDYRSGVQAAEGKIRAEPVPPGLEAFHGKLLEALALQQTFFAKAVEACEAHQTWEQVIAIPEGHEASGLLRGAWGDMQQRYPSWEPAVQDSVFHHLCALDLF